MRNSIRLRLALCLLGLFVIGCAAAKPVQSNKPDFSFAVMSDIQYGDKPYGCNPVRHYRQSLDRLRDAVTDLNTRDLAFAIQCGDIIDGWESKDRSLADLDTVLAEYNKLACYRFHVLGNHCVSAGMADLCEALAVPGGYYAFSTPRTKGWVFAVFDGNGLADPARAKTQLAWLEGTLKQARTGKKKVMAFCHYPLVTGRRPHGGLPPDSPALKLLENSHCVVACFYGHEHVPNYAFKNGIHHVILAGMVENPSEGAYGVVEVYGDRLKLVGFGGQPGCMMYFGKAAHVDFQQQR